MGRGVEEGSLGRAVLLGVGAMVVVAGVVGAVMAVVALGAARVAGLDGGGGAAGPSEEASLYVPRYQPTVTMPEEWPGLPSPASPGFAGPPAAGGSGGEEKPTPQPKKKKPAPQITLEASPSAVAAGERISLTGRYRGGDGATLQVQRREEGGWEDFPVSASVRDGRYETWILTTRTGVSRFRVVDAGAGRVSNAIEVTIG